MLKQTTVYNVSLDLHAKFEKYHLKCDAVSVFSLVQGYNTFSFVLRTIGVYLCLERCTYLERCPCVSLSNVLRLVGVVFVAVVSGCQFGTYETPIFLNFHCMQLSSGFTFGDNVTFSVLQLSA